MSRLPKWLSGSLAYVGDFFGLLWDHIRDLLVRLHLISRYDFDFISPRVATGAAPVDQGFVDALIKAGVTHILDVTDAEDDRSLLPANFHYLYNPTADDGQPKPVEWFKASLDFALPALEEQGTKCFCHCTSGINRGPSCAYAILRAQGMSEVSVLELFSLHRPQAKIGYRADAERALKALGYTT